MSHVLQTLDLNQSAAMTQGHIRTNKYNHINTLEVIDTFEKNGVFFEKVSQAKAKSNNNGYQKHVLVFDTQQQIDNNNKLTMLVTNSHDGLSSLKIDIGIFRTVCANGIVIGENFFSRRVKHIGNVRENLSEAISESLRALPKVAELIRQWQSIEATPEMIEQLQNFIIDNRIRKHVSSIDRSTIAQVRRHEDNKNDLYTVFNRFQESLIRGGVEYKALSIKDGHVEKRRQILREIKSATKRIELNQELFDFTEKLAA